MHGAGQIRNSTNRRQLNEGRIMTASTQAEAEASKGTLSFHERFDEVFSALKIPQGADPVAGLAKCLEIARRVEAECHADALPPAIDMLVDYGIEREKFMDLLLKTSQYGSAHMLVRILSSVQEVTLLATQTEGEA